MSELKKLNNNDLQNELREHVRKLVGDNERVQEMCNEYAARNTVTRLKELKIDVSSINQDELCDSLIYWGAYTSFLNQALVGMIDGGVNYSSSPIN